MPLCICDCVNVCVCTDLRTCLMRSTQSFQVGDNTVPKSAGNPTAFTFSHHSVLRKWGFSSVKEEAQVQKGFCGTDCAADCQSETEDFPYVPFSFTYPHRCDL